MRITRAMIRAFPDVIFIYGDTLYHDGDGGQATEARGESNAYPVPVKLRKCANDETAFFNDSFFELNCRHIDRAINAIPDNNNPICVFPRLGRGWNKLEDKAPKTYTYLINAIFYGRLFVDRISIKPSYILQKYNSKQVRRNEDFSRSAQEKAEEVGN